MLACSRWSISTAIRGALVISFSVCVCILCLFLSHAFSNFHMSQSEPPKPAPATYYYYHLVLLLLSSLFIAYYMSISTNYPAIIHTPEMREW